mmetsp:Transcript_6309/g.11218  ORF Transcript_6309/g.11218 Transcript_6309/m.11218 type:complete len:422 (-) Transcript_6309:188-1453(-)
MTKDSIPTDPAMAATFENTVVGRSESCVKSETFTTMDSEISNATSSSSSVVEKNCGGVTLVAKWGKERISLEGLAPTTTIGQVKNLLTVQTSILAKRQKLVGLTLSAARKGGVTDTDMLSDLKVKGKSNSSNNNSVQHQFILMGTPEEHIFVDPSEKDDLPDVIDDFELDFNAGSDEWLQHVANGENLKKFTEHTAIHIMNPPREGKPLLVLDLDHTLLDFSSRQLREAGPEGNSTAALSAQEVVARMKRPHMDQFLSKAYQFYDLVVWSQTSWRWLETKLIELGMLTHPGYKFCFVLDKTSMFAVTSTKRDGSKFNHHVKPMQIIWSKFPNLWGSHNSVHVDDLTRNFALNLSTGLKVTAYYRKKNKKKRDAELLGLARYLEGLAQTVSNFDDVDFSQWMDVVSGKRPLLKDNTNDESRP